MANKFKTLHEAMAFILAEQPNRTATTEFLAEEIKRGQMWARPKDDDFPKAWQIRLRAISKAGHRYFLMSEDDKSVTLLCPVGKDQSQIALSVVEKAIGGKLANPEASTS